MESSNTSALDVSKKWFLVPLPLRTCSLKDIATTTVEKEDMDRYFNEAQAVLEKECGNGQQDRGRWYNAQFLARGTTADKVAAAAVKLTDNDFMFFLDGFNQLFDTARTDTHHYEAALKALAAVWPKLLPPRPLKRFVVQYFATLPTEDGPRRRVLVYWYLEDFLKRTYAQFLSLCEAMLKDRLMQRREAWLEVVGKLLCSVAESRHTVMAMMIDKLGDPNAQLAHKAYHYLLKLLSESSTHQTMLFTELEKIVFMPNCPLRTMRYAANVMNQLVFSKDERRLALKSVQTYLLLFRQLVMTGHVDSTVTTAIIVGLRRAFPYAGTDIAPLEKHLNALFVLANTGNFQQRVATLSLLQLLALGKGTQEAFRHRWYRALYQLLLLSPKQLPQSAQLTNFFSMLHKAMRADTNDERVAAFVHRLLQRAVYFTDAMVCAVLLLVGEMAQTRPSVRRLLQQAPSHDSAAEEKRYDPKHREPQYARARQECLWTLNLLAHHSHPSVVKLAVLLLFGEETVFDVHPLDDMTPLNFLEMFVESKSQAKEDSTGGSSGGSSVFRRAVHAPTIPRASDPYFIGAKARDVDVSALFLHRYAVQRQRFVEGLSQVQPTWGATSGEDDVVMRVSNLDAALFGPTGVLADDSTEGRAEKEEAEEEVKKTKKTSTKKAPKAPIEQDEDVPSEEDEDLHPEQWSGGSEGSSASADFDAEGSEDDLEWGSDDEAAYDGAVEDDDGYSDDDGDDNALGGSRASKRDEVDGDEFGEIMAASNKAPSKKRMREDAWLESRSSDAPARGRFGEQQRSYSGRGSSSSRGRGGRGGRGGRYTGGPSRGGRGAGRR